MNPPANKRKIFAGVLIAGTLIFVLAIVLCNSVPGKASKMLSSSIASAEAGIEQMYPGYLDEVLDKAEFEAFIGSGIEMSDGADSLAVLSQILKMPGIAPVRKAVESILGGADAFVAEFDATGTPFTLHNILQSVQDEVNAGVRKAVGAAKTIIVVIALLFYIATFAVYAAYGKGFFTPKNSSLNFGDAEEGK